MRVYYGRRSQPSGLRLQRALREAGYMGNDVNFGLARNPRGINGLLDSNKRVALRKMIEAGVPTPNVYRPDEIYDASYPLIGRPDRHRAGRHLYLCRNEREAERAINRGATHFLEFIPDAREFRVHVAFGKSIKIAEKVGGYGHVRNRRHNWYFAYPTGFTHKLTLRRVAKQAVMSLRLDFGAVDVLYSNGQFFVLEVNSAPDLTSRSDTLERYVRAITESQC